LDFTLKTYGRLLDNLSENGYSFQTFEEFIVARKKKVIVLRHDVDKVPQNALRMAKLENEKGIKASYYFRIVKDSNDPEVIKKIAKLGHEIGYHYEDFSLAKGDYEKAIEYFKNNLNYFRSLYPVKTICMHGSPLSKWDNRTLWKNYNYRDYNVIAEPYFDIDYNEILYLTDSGRSWNKSNVVVRDKVKSSFSYNIISTNDLINKISNNLLPQNMIINTHPQRWYNPGIQWLIEFISQNVKNQIKRVYIKEPI
jgi:hypothetical protein